MNRFLLIPCYNRPELLHFALRFLERCRGLDRVNALFCIENRADATNHALEDVLETIRSFRGAASVTIVFPPKHSFPGNSFNVLYGIRACLERDADRIYYVEDDTAVSAAFFDWHDYVLERSQASASLACTNLCTHYPTPYPKPNPQPSPRAFYTSQTDYSSIGSCLTQLLASLTLQHNTPVFYTNPIEYCQTKFPNNPIPPHQAEQDGLIRRVLHANNLTAAWSAYPYPHAYHFGLWGYHRNYQKPPNQLPLAAKIAQTEKLLREIPTTQDVTNLSEIERAFFHVEERFYATDD